MTDTEGTANPASSQTSTVDIISDSGPRPRGTITFSDVDFSHDADNGPTLFKDLNLQINAGESVAILGRTGSGKSTLLNLISGIDLPTEGEIWIADVNVTRLSERERTLLRRKHIGFIFQFFNLIPTLTAGENISLPIELAGTSERQARQRALDLLERVGLADRFDDYPDQLSGGEQQRIAIARALLNDPELILADEPTGNLDPQTSVEVMEVLQEINKNGNTILMATHDYALLLKYPSKTLKCDENKVYEVVQRNTSLSK